MSNPKQAAFENLQRLSVTLRDIIAIGPELAAIGSIEQATTEAQRKLDAVRSQLNTETRSHADRLTSERAAAEAELSGSRVKAGRIQADAENAASRKLKDANDRAETILADAQARALKIESDLGLAIADRRTALAEAQHELDVVREAIADTTRCLDGLKKSHADLTEQHQSVKSALAALKAKL